MNLTYQNFSTQGTLAFLLYNESAQGVFVDEITNQLANNFVWPLILVMYYPLVNNFSNHICYPHNNLSKLTAGQPKLTLVCSLTLAAQCLVTKFGSHKAF